MAGRTRTAGSIGNRILKEFPFFAQEILRIRAKDGNVIPFRLNKAQRYLHAAIEKQLAETGKVRMLGLKGRQQGFSTYVQGRFSRHILSGRGLRAFILTHEQEATNNLFEIAERFWNEAPFDPGIDENNAKEIYFADNDCGYKVGTAGNKATGRSSTLQLLHGSEIAHWPNASAHFSGVIQAVPDAPGTEIILESTANGVGGLFHQLCLDALAGIGDYRLVFIPWFWQNEYQRDAKGFIPTAAEQALMKLHGLTHEQLAWRRAKIYELKSEALFHQEYPCIIGSTRIATERGIVPMSEVVAGDVGDCGIITRQWSTGVKPVFDIETKLGYRLTATANHPLASADGGGVDVESSLGQCVRLQPPIFSTQEYIATWKPAPCVESRLAITPDVGRFLGFFMGDGSFHADTLSIVCDASDTDVVEDARYLVEMMSGRSSTRAVGTRLGGTEVRAGWRYGREVLGAIGAINTGTCGNIRRNVCVPDAIWRSPRNVVREFLRGLFEADGFAGDGVPRVILFSRYRAFLQDVQLLLLGFGITCRLRSANKKSGDGHIYEGHELSLRTEEARLFRGHIGFISSRKQGRMDSWQKKGHGGRKPYPVVMEDMIVRCDPAGEAEVFDLTVSGSHVFGANGLLVHNCTVEEAFIFSGRPVFDQIKLQDELAECFAPKYRAEIDSRGNIIKREDGRLRVWKDPQEGHRYVIGSDVAEGLEHGDYSCADVLDALDGTLVAQWHGHIDPDQFGAINEQLGYRYHKALVGIERNNHGLTTLTHLRNAGYPRLYAQEDIERRSDGFQTKKFGWLTTSKSKVKIIDQMAAELRDDELRVFDAETIKEMGGFVIHEDGSLGAKPGGFDDRVMARAIAGEMLLTLPRRGT